MGDKAFVQVKVMTNGHFCSVECEFLERATGKTAFCSLFNLVLVKQGSSFHRHIRCDKCIKHELE